jgi:hypothetical protein
VGLAVSGEAAVADTRADAKPDTRADAEPDTRADAKPDTRADTKPDADPDGDARGAERDGWRPCCPPEHRWSAEW